MAAGLANTMASSVTKWLSVQSERSQGVNTLPNCLVLCDLKCDNYWKLVAADLPADLQLRPKLKVFKGLEMVSEQGLLGLPTAVEAFFINEPEPKSPIIGVAISECIYFYRNMKPYFKFTAPELPVNTQEVEVWRKLPVERVENQPALIASLEEIDFSALTSRSQKLLRLPPADRDRFIKEHADEPLKHHSMIVAMKCLPKASSDYVPPSFVVVLCENGNLFIVDVQGFKVVHQAQVCSYDTTPSLMAVQGQYETDFRIVIASRNGTVYILHKAWLEGKEILKFDCPLVSLALMPIDQTIVAAGMDKELVCFSKKGKRLYSIRLAEVPVCLTPVHLPHLGTTLICVALRGGSVQFYLQKCLVEDMVLEATVNAMVFGRLGQEEYVLTLVTQAGDLHVKILKRTASFEVGGRSLEVGRVHADEKDGKAVLEIPKKSSVFVEQATREKDFAQSIYSSFQVELWRLRLSAARSTVEALSSAESTISGDLAQAPIKLSAEVCVTGPQFKVFLVIENMSPRKPATNLKILLHANRNHYKIPKSRIALPILMPGIPFKIDLDVFVVLDPIDGFPPTELTTDNSIIRVLVLRDAQVTPLIAAIVAMPVPEPPLEK